MDQMIERLAGNDYYCFLDCFSGYFQISIDPHDQEKTTFTCPYGLFAYRRMPFGLCNVPGTFQRCMMAIFHDMIEKTMEVFMDDFLVFGNSFKNCLSRVDKMLQRYVVPTGRVIATDSVIVATSGYVVPAAYDISPGRVKLKSLSRAETLQVLSEPGESLVENILLLWLLNHYNGLTNRIAVHREIKARKLFTSVLPADNMADFHHLVDAKDIWWWCSNKGQIGGNEESKKMRKSMLKQEFEDFKISESEGLHRDMIGFRRDESNLNQMKQGQRMKTANMKFLRALPLLGRSSNNRFDRRLGMKVDWIQRQGISIKIKELDKSEDTKRLLVSVDSMLSWSGPRKSKDMEKGAFCVYGMIAVMEDDYIIPTGLMLTDELKKEFDNLEVQYKECFLQVQAYKSSLQNLEQTEILVPNNKLALEGENSNYDAD
ncbi:reverse transcriptase domain-containing protein [Tanacetum coccineum]